MCSVYHTYNNRKKHNPQKGGDTHDMVSAAVSRAEGGYSRATPNGHLSTKEATECLGLPEQTSRNLIVEKRTKAETVGSIWPI
jgi:hypothetical protein